VACIIHDHQYREQHGRMRRWQADAKLRRNVRILLAALRPPSWAIIDSRLPKSIETEVVAWGYWLGVTLGGRLAWVRWRWRGARKRCSTEA
jgi:hypothetical protein